MRLVARRSAPGGIGAINRGGIGIGMYAAYLARRCKGVRTRFDAHEARGERSLHRLGRYAKDLRDRLFRSARSRN